MAASFGSTLGGCDLPKLMAAVLDAQEYTRNPPTRMVRLSEVPVAPDWRDRLLALEEIAVEWGPGQRIAANRETISMRSEFERAPAPPKVLALFAGLPFELAVMTSVRDYWIEHDYFAPAISGDHAVLGWGMAFKGAGHEHSIVSRRWLEYGPFQTLQGPNDTTLVQFHDLAADGPTSLAQAAPGHAWIVEGFLRPKHRYEHDIAGIYTKEDGLLRIVVNDRRLSDSELLDACAARRDGRDDPAKPIRNIAYVFVDDAEARANLEALWLRGLECRVADGRGERRLDEDYQPQLAKPAWVAAT